MSSILYYILSKYPGESWAIANLAAMACLIHSPMRYLNFLTEERYNNLLQLSRSLPQNEASRLLNSDHFKVLEKSLKVKPVHFIGSTFGCVALTYTVIGLSSDMIKSKNLPLDKVLVCMFNTAYALYFGFEAVEYLKQDHQTAQAYEVIFSDNVDNFAQTDLVGQNNQIPIAQVLHFN